MILEQKKSAEKALLESYLLEKKNFKMMAKDRQKMKKPTISYYKSS